MERICTYAVIPARDEERHIAMVISDVAPFVDGICVIDDGSKDCTAKYAWKALEDQTQLEIAEVITGLGEGPGAAVRRGIEHLHAIGVNEEHCCAIIDGDGQIPAMLIPEASAIITRSDQESILVKGVRTPEAHSRAPRIRRWLGRCSALAASLALGMKINDAHCGFAAARLQTMRYLACECPWNGYGYPAHWLLMQKQSGGGIETLPTPTYYGDEKSALRIHRLFLPLFKIYLQGLLLRVLRACSRAKNKEHLPVRTNPSISET